MKKLILILTLIFCAQGIAQPSAKMQERIKAQKVAFITERLNLSAEEAQGFWPIYNAFEAKLEALRKSDLRDIKIKMREGNVSESEANSLLKKLMNAETQVHNSKMQLMNDLKSVISAEKIIRLKAAEEAFNKKLLERLREFRDKRAKRN